MREDAKGNEEIIKPDVVLEKNKLVIEEDRYQMTEKIVTRIRNPKVLVGVISGVLMILVNFEVISIDLSNQISDLVNAVLSIGISIGIFANPESHVKDDQANYNQE
ncbi:phage holin family protein [Exiguobacterium undae]|nr:phage holin family protein [Exiguobacterium undae]